MHFSTLMGLGYSKHCQKNFPKATQRPNRDVLRIGLIMLQKTAPPMNTIVKTNNRTSDRPLTGRVPYFPNEISSKNDFS